MKVINKATVVNAKKLNGKVPPQAETIHASDESATGERIYQRYNEARDEFMKFMGAPGWKRTLVAVASGLLVACGMGWIAGTLIGWLMAGAMLAGASMFLVMCIYVLGIVSAAYAGGRVAARVFGSVITGEADLKAIAAYDAAKDFAAKCNPMRLFQRSAGATVH